MNPLLAAAHALGREAHRRGTQSIFDDRPAPIEDENPSRPMLIEGRIIAGEMLIDLPNGDRWSCHIEQTGDVPLAPTMLVCIHDPNAATMFFFRPGPEGIHPFAGVARRFGVEKGGAR